mgnify:CR=1 FL=1
MKFQISVPNNRLSGFPTALALGWTQPKCHMGRPSAQIPISNIAHFRLSTFLLLRRSKNEYLEFLI